MENAVVAVEESCVLDVKSGKLFSYHKTIKQ